MTPTVSARERLLDATEAVIAEEGWTAATTRRVAERAGVAPGLVHYHAGSVEMLRRDATLRAIRRFFDQPVSGYEPTRAGARAWVGGLLSPEGVGEPGPELRILHESLPAAGRDDVLRDAIAELLRLYREQLATALRAGGHSASRASALAATLAAAVDGAILQRSLDPGIDLEPVVDALAALVETSSRSRGRKQDAPDTSPRG